jgi:hypothetical protein
VKTYDLTPPDTGKAAVGAYSWLVTDLLEAPTVHTGEWQAMDTKASKAHATHELEDVTIFIDPLPRGMDDVVPAIDHSWADAHFLERVSGEPMNPAPSHLDWPYAVRGNADHTTGAHRKFDHTYPERFWPKHAGIACRTPEECMGTCSGYHGQNKGIRFVYGDLNDLVDLLVHKPLTRQAYLPIWFPEDTGAGLASYGDGQTVRVPCTLGYHFMIRDGRLSCRYYLRSCDIYRHFSNDVYFAAMLTRWVAQEVNRRSAEANGLDMVTRPVQLGRLVMHVTSLHAFVGDVPKIKDRMNSL